MLDARCPMPRRGPFSRGSYKLQTDPRWHLRSSKLALPGLSRGGARLDVSGWRPLPAVIPDGDGALPRRLVCKSLPIQLWGRTGTKNAAQTVRHAREAAGKSPTPRSSLPAPILTAKWQWETKTVLSLGWGGFLLKKGREASSRPLQGQKKTRGRLGTSWGLRRRALCLSTVVPYIMRLCARGPLRRQPGRGVENC
jgi:hypothetical protein